MWWTASTRFLALNVGNYAITSWSSLTDENGDDCEMPLAVLLCSGSGNLARRALSCCQDVVSGLQVEGPGVLAPAGDGRRPSDVWRPLAGTVPAEAERLASENFAMAQAMSWGDDLTVNGRPVVWLWPDQSAGSVRLAPEFLTWCQRAGATLQPTGPGALCGYPGGGSSIQNECLISSQLDIEIIQPDSDDAHQGFNTLCRWCARGARQPRRSPPA